MTRFHADEATDVGRVRENNQDLALSEGAPNLVQYNYLAKDASAQARFMRQEMLADQTPYGVGMRRLQKYEQAKGQAGVLAVLKASSAIPRGY